MEQLPIAAVALATYMVADYIPLSFVVGVLFANIIHSQRIQSSMISVASSGVRKLREKTVTPITQPPPKEDPPVLPENQSRLSLSDTDDD
jgi:hypothetical protein